MYSVAEAIEKFKTILQGKTSWANLIRSQFVEHLAVFASWALRSAQWFVERASQEFWIATALNRSSIIAHAEDREYLPIKPTVSSGEISVENTGDAEFSLPTGTEFLTDEQIVLTTTDALVVASAATETVAVDQKEYEEYTEEVEAEESFYEILISQEATPEISSFDVYIDGEQWEYSRLLQNAYSDSQMYDEFYAGTDQIGVRFGNGTFGLIPPEDSEIVIKAWKTQGDVFLATGQEIFPVDEILDADTNVASMKVTISTAVEGGQGGEEEETIRKSLHYWPIFNDQLVWDDDYVFFTKRRFPDIVWMNVWGEKEAEVQAGSLDLDFINTIFVSAYESGGADISTSIIAALEEEALKTNRQFSWVDPVPLTYAATIIGKVEKSRNVTDIKTEIEELLTANYGADSETRKNIVLVKDFYSLIEALGYSDKKNEYFIVSFTDIYKGDWVVDTFYLVGDIISHTDNETLLRCVVAHTSSGSEPAADGSDDEWEVLSNYQGDWSQSTTYYVGDIVSHSNGTTLLRCIVAHTTGPAEDEPPAIGDTQWNVVVNTEPGLLEEFVALDIDNSNITIEYL